MNRILQQTRRYAAVAAGALSLAAGAVKAAPIDVSDVVTNINDQITPITAIGGAVLLIVVAVASFRWVRSAMR